MNPHSKKLGQECVKRAQAKWGRQAWDMLSREQQQGAIALEAVSVLLNQADTNPALNHCQDVARAALWEE